MSIDVLTSNGAHGVGAKAAVIRHLNDCFRQSLTGGGVMLTSGVSSMPTDQKLALLAAAQQFDTFDAGNDPHQEHDFGAIELCGERYFWKIDYYDLDHQYRSPDPSDADVTSRVLTIMRAEEY